MSDTKRSYMENKINISDNKESDTLLQKHVPNYENLIKNGFSEISACLQLVYVYYHGDNSTKNKALARDYCTQAVDKCINKQVDNLDNKYYSEDFKDMASVAYMADILGVCKDHILNLYKRSFEMDNSNIVM